MLNNFYSIVPVTLSGSAYLIRLHYLCSSPADANEYYLTTYRYCVQLIFDLDLPILGVKCLASYVQHD
jgi:hypothetical protein